AEDGIRDRNVTGVQTCALPISALAMIALWNGIGGNRMMIFLAGLQGVPQELVDAAQVDGANGWQRFRHVTLPMISPTIFFNLVRSEERRVGKEGSGVRWRDART